jgi:ankyrin repeat protein
MHWTDEGKWTHLHLAADARRTKMAAVLGATGVNVDCGDVEDWTPQINACKRGNTFVMKYLLSVGTPCHSITYLSIPYI